MPYLTPNTIPNDDFVCRVVRIPNDPALVWAFSGAIIELTKRYNWEQFGEMTPDETAEACQSVLFEYLDSDFCMIGSIFPYASEKPPKHCLDCDGATYNRVDYPKLYAALDASFILDADTFTVPNLNNRFVIGAGDDYAIGSTGGAAEVTLTVDQMPEHNHEDAGHLHSTHGHVTLLAVIPGEGPVSAPSPVPEVTTSSQANILPAGGGQAHNNMPPYVALPYCIVAR